MLEKAVAKAKRQAASMLKPLEQKPGKALFISNTETSVNRITNSNIRGLNSVKLYETYRYSESNFSSIGITHMRVQVSVTVYFEIL